MDTASQVNEIDRLFLKLGLARLELVATLKQNGPDREEENNNKTELEDQIKFWQDDLNSKYAEITMNQGSMRLAPKSLRLATTLLKQNGTLANAANSSSHPRYQHIGYILLCAGKLVKLLNDQHTEHEKQIENSLFLQKC